MAFRGKISSQCDLKTREEKGEKKKMRKKRKRERKNEKERECASSAMKKVHGCSSARVKCIL